MSFIAIIGKSGCGKTTIANGLVARFDWMYRRAKSYTTRPRRINEGEEYSFVSNEKINDMLREGRVAYIDEVFGYKYAMDMDSFYYKNYDIIKEIHPQNVEKIKKFTDDVITVHIISNSVQDDRARDDEFDYDSYKADLIINNEINTDLDALIINTSRSIQAIKLQKMMNFPCGDVIDKTNKIGYNNIANEFQDSKRITTANFHDVSESFFIRKFKALKPNSKILELGSGNGWLTSVLGYQIPSIDISDEMYAGQKQRHIGIRQLCDEDATYDAIFASLCDPYFYPEAISTILRILKVGGELHISLPSREWSILNRKGRYTTIFQGCGGAAYEVFSFTYEKDELELMGKRLGFQITDYEKKALCPNYTGIISKEISKPADENGVEINQLCIIDCYTITREY